MTKKIIRTKTVSEEPRIFAESITVENSYLSSIRPDEKFSHYLYVFFRKEDFPLFNYPKLVEGFTEGTERFDYYESDFAIIEMHGGITFYQERYFPDSKITEIRIGCDYQHLYDYHYTTSDNGEMILGHADYIVKQLKEIYEVRVKDNEQA